MQRYGLQRKRTQQTTRPEWVRGNRGRNRSTIDRSKASKRTKFAKARLDTEIARCLRRRAREDGKRQIREELQLDWLERELRNVSSHRRDRSLTYLSAIAMPEEIDSVLAEAMWMDDLQFDWNSTFDAIRDEDDAEDEEYQRTYQRRRPSFDYLGDDFDDHGAYDTWGDYDPDPEPSSEAWRDLWVAGRAHDPEGRDYEDARWGNYDEDTLYDEIEEYEDRHVWSLLDRPIVDVTLNSPNVERDLERHRAGERYFRHHKRTVQKGPLVVGSAMCRQRIAFVDGSLSFARAEAFRAHLKECNGCREGLVESMQLVTRLQLMSRKAS